MRRRAAQSLFEVAGRTASNQGHRDKFRVDRLRPAHADPGLYSLSAASLAFELLTDADRKGLPAYPVPAVRIGRLATSISVRGQGFGELLLQNAIKRTLQARTTLGVCAVIVEAKDAAAESFYRKYGFRLCDPQTRQLDLPLGAQDITDAWPHTR